MIPGFGSVIALFVLIIHMTNCIYSHSEVMRVHDSLILKKQEVLMLILGISFSYPVTTVASGGISSFIKNNYLTCSQIISIESNPNGGWVGGSAFD